MSQGSEIWTPAAVQLLQDAYRSVDPLMTDERFAQDVLRIATRTLYNWRTRPETKLRSVVQRELSRALIAAPPEVVERFRALQYPAADRASSATSATENLTVYPAALDGAVAVLTSLADPSTGLVDYRPSDLAATVLDWLTSSIGQPTGDSDGGRLTAGDVTQIRTMISAIDTIERTVGGAECRATAQRYLHTVALPMLQREVESQARSELFSAVAELCEIVGWMHYDAGQHGTGQAYFTQALRLTREVGDDALSAYLMTTVAHQALHLGEPAAALRVARAGRTVAESAGSPHVLVEADLLVARSHAALGQVKDATVALQHAERSYERSAASGARAWEPQWDDVMFASHAGTCWSDVGNFKEARRLLMHVWDSSAGRPRRLIYSAAELGIAAVRGGEVDLACQHGHDVLALREKVDSSRTQENLDRLAYELRPFRTTGVVREFFDASGLDPESATK
jgi:tetratricopeptide (TPR) repeat protein